MKDLKELLDSPDIQTMKDAFEVLWGNDAEILIHSSFGSSYIPIEIRKEFVILEDVGNKTQLLHPYGLGIGYELHRLGKE